VAALPPTDDLAPAPRPEPAAAGCSPPSSLSGAAGDADDPGVLVRLGAGRYALPMTAVAEVGRVPKITRIPGLPAWVAGAANWRGRLLPVVDLRVLLTAQAADPTAVPVRDARLVVCAFDGMSLGLLVDAVCGVLPLPEGPAEPAPAGLAGSAAALLGGQLVDGDGPVGLLSVPAVFGLRAALPRPRGAEARSR
jgi:chemotaxis signal transduction protein